MQPLDSKKAVQSLNENLHKTDIRISLVLETHSIHNQQKIRTSLLFRRFYYRKTAGPRRNIKSLLTSHNHPKEIDGY